MPDAGRFSELGEQGSRAVMEAAAVLERELSAGLADAKAATSRLTGEHRVDQDEFDQLVRRVSENTHQLIDAVSARVLAGTTGEVSEQAQRLTANAHDVLDLLLSLGALAPGLANRTMQSAFGPQHERTGEAAGGGTGADERPNG
ncbi:hypothetical protein [Kitasatospora sp. NPDC093806]|uniref:hypothetical protein n=1 Tax=Kitasatospora sp. NPDC093806 TaxID=3155075 RepID=UPI0034131673